MLTEGATVMAAVVAPVLQRYVPPPLAVTVVEDPKQTEVPPLTEAVGRELTVTVARAVDTHPPLAVTVTI